LKRIAEKDLEVWRATFAPGPVSNDRQFVAMLAPVWIRIFLPMFWRRRDATRVGPCGGWSSDW